MHTEKQYVGNNTKNNYDVPKNGKKNYVEKKRI